MRKTQMALAAVALVASTAAMAQVTVYGNADGGLISSGGKTAVDGGGGYTTSLIGFRGSEDLGGGLKASFNLETGANLGAGQRGGAAGGNTNLFNRAANVGLGNESVGITFGNQFSIAVADALTGATAGAGDNVNVTGVQRLILSPANVEQSGMDNNAGAVGSTAFFVPDAVTLRASGGGFTFKAMSRVKPKDGDNSAYTAFTLGGSLEGVNWSVGQQQSSGTGAAFNYKTTFLAANAKFGDFGVNGAWATNSGDATGADGKTYMLGASYALSEALSVGALYAKGNATLGNQTSVNLKYSLSKSTVAYVTTSMFSVAGAGAYANTGALGATAAGKNVTSAGISYSF